MKPTLITLLLFLGFSSVTKAQTPSSLQEIVTRQARLQKTGTWTLAGWSVANLAVSGLAIGRAKGSARYFHEMNLYWNVVNVGIASMGLLALRKKMILLRFPLLPKNTIHSKKACC
ncbi:MAG: hypothetical protein R2822_16350 [Spirosomataceae bacterium]